MNHKKAGEMSLFPISAPMPIRISLLSLFPFFLVLVLILTQEWILPIECVSIASYPLGPGYPPSIGGYGFQPGAIPLVPFYMDPSYNINVSVSLNSSFSTISSATGSGNMTFQVGQFVFNFGPPRIPLGTQ